MAYYSQTMETDDDTKIEDNRNHQSVKLDVSNAGSIASVLEDIYQVIQALKNMTITPKNDFRNANKKLFLVSIVVRSIM